MPKDKKKILQTPCLFPNPNPKRKGETLAPQVDCYYDCSRCGWNPAEKNRRLKYGVYVQHDDVVTLHFRRKADDE